MQPTTEEVEAGQAVYTRGASDQVRTASARAQNVQPQGAFRS